MVNLPNPYASKHYYLLGAIPVVLIIIAALFIPSIPKGVDLKGGTLITISSSTPINSNALQAALAKISPSVTVSTISTPAGYGVEAQLENSANFDTAENDLYNLASMDSQLSALQESGSNDPQTQLQITSLSTQIIQQSSTILQLVGSNQTAPSNDAHAAAALAQSEFSAQDQALSQQIQSVVQQAAPGANISIQEVGSTLSQQFLNQAAQIVLYAFILSAIAIFIVFRSAGPSIAVIFGAMADIIITAGVMGMLQIPLTLPSIATLLMLIGFSLDTDVMMAIRVMQRKGGTAADRAAKALVTGAMMNLTTIGAFGVLYIVGTMLQVPTYQQIGVVAVIGGCADFIATWCFDASIILYFTKRKEHGHEAVNAG